MKLSRIKRAIKLLWQDCTRGWNDSATWSLDHNIAKIIAPRLKRFKELHNGHPYSIDQQQWNDILDKMIATFEFYGSDHVWLAEREEFDKHQEGLDLFAKWFNNLWW